MMSHVYNKTHCETNIAFNYYYHYFFYDTSSVCRSGTWECTEDKCPGTCVIYGSGHYNTFDKIAYGFQGHCAYVAVKVKIQIKMLNRVGPILF